MRKVPQSFLPHLPTYPCQAFSKWILRKEWEPVVKNLRKR